MEKSTGTGFKEDSGTPTDVSQERVKGSWG
jgi:hypothetical protein